MKQASFKIIVPLLSISLCLGLIELFGFFFPNSLPRQLQNFYQNPGLGEQKIKVLEFLDTNPFVKFRPKTIVRTQGSRGTEEQFVYTWETDSQGFKNPPDMAKQDSLFAVALGDSFTEGLGTAIEDTWPSKLTAMGYPTYNLGVQGYAPKQLAGSLEMYGLKFKPKYILVGHTSTFHYRERFFLDEEQVKELKMYAGGVDSFAQNIDEIRKQGQWVTEAIYLLLKFNWITKKKIARARMEREQFYKSYDAGRKQESIGPVKIQFEPMKSYKTDFELIGGRRSEDLESSLEWQSTLDTYIKIKEMADRINSKVVLVYMVGRGPAYFEKATGKKLPKTYLRKKIPEQLKLFARKNNMIFINTAPVLKQHSDNLTLSSKIEDYPYLEIDGHLSATGNRLVAETIARHFTKSQASPSRN